jgi:hypothetical protein
MHFPATSAPLTFLMTPSRKFLQFNQFTYPALQVRSLINRANETPIIQATSANQPIWAQSLLAGQYMSGNTPGFPATSSGQTPGLPGLSFTGSQYLEYDALASLYAGAETPLTVVAMVACGSAGGTVWSFGSATTTKLSLSYAGGTLSLTEVNGNGTFTASATMDNNLHIVSAIRMNNTLILRIDNAQVATAAITASTESFTTFVLGALNTSGSVSSQFTGSMGHVAVYSGSADVLPVEVFLLQVAGIIRGPSSGINSGGF